ncbi:MAG: dihydrofolate reductase [Candidatus Doudnabacteria bacterium]|nr:dihydrofolate reductase [Candidatus Doudnabacteria bacterium]
MIISFVVAVAQNGVIGSHNDLPFYIPEDLRHFKKLTEGRTVLMGRNTFNSILKRLGKPLPNRKNVVVTHDLNFHQEGVIVFHSLEEALKQLEKDTDELMIAGGAQIYKQLVDLGQVDRIYMTHVHKKVEGDIMFPELDLSKWKKFDEERHEEFTWTTYDRI